MTDIRNTKITYSFSRDSDESALTITPESQPLLPHMSSYNVICDLTLNKSMHLPNQKARKIVDLRHKAQAGYLSEMNREIMRRYNAHGADKLIYSFIVYEIQSTTFCVHTHANLKIDIKTTEINAVAKLRDIVLSLGFNPRGICTEYIKNYEDRYAYLLKKATKYDKPFLFLDSK